jgi:hypothetical protein
VAKLPPGPLKQSLTALLAESGGDLDAFKRSVETWFGNVMNRVRGTYKRFVHFATLVIGLALAVLLNVDTLRITTTLWVEPGTRASLAEAATRYLDAHRELAPDKEQALSDEARAQLAGLLVPMGWAADAQGRRPLGWSSPICWLLTGLAISLSAPFWFDLL